MIGTWSNGITITWKLKYEMNTYEHICGYIGIGGSNAKAIPSLFSVHTRKKV